MVRIFFFVKVSVRHLLIKFVDIHAMVSRQLDK